MECFYWSVGYNSRPEYWYARRALTAVTAFITTIDDIYDVYGTLEELEVLTELTKRWTSIINRLSEYMDNAWILITGPVILTHSYFLTANSNTDDALQYLKTYPKIIRLSAKILRLVDDMGTSSVQK